MLGLMQNWPLLLHRIIDHAAIQHGTREVVTRAVEDGTLRRRTYREIRSRALQAAKRLQREGIKLGDRVATLAWNSDRHLELWYGISGIGAITHTVNPRLFPEQIACIVNHAEDRLMFLDLSFVPMIEAIQEKLPSIARYVVLTDLAHMLQTSLKGAVAYEDWLAEADDDFAWGTFDENTAAGLCYTSGTTGGPKGVLYSHRSNVLHAMACAAPDYMGLSARDTVMPVVPLFHANSWSLAYSAPMTGAKLVMPGAKLDGLSLHQLLEEEGVTFTAAVPTIWLGLLQHLESTAGTLSTLKRVAIGGSACPRVMIETFERSYGVTVSHGWGMTEMSPVGSMCTVKAAYAGLEGDALYALKTKQGHPLFTVEFRLTDDAGNDLPWDGRTVDA